MKRLLILLISLVSSVAAFGQQGSLSQSGIFLRVNDTTTYQTSAAGKHAQGYRDIYFNNQATNKHFDIWNGSSYDHIFDFMSGSGSGGSDLTWADPVTLTTYTVTDSDDGKIIPLSNASGCTVTLSNTVSANVTVSFVRLLGAGEITFVASGTAVLRSKGDEVTIESEEAWATWSKNTATEWRGVGSLGPDGGGGGGGTTYTFTASDFNESGTTVSIDYTNGQAATSSQKGFLTSADWTTFNGKSTHAVQINTKSASYTLTSSDLTDWNAGKILVFNMAVASANTFTIPPDATVSFPTGTIVFIDWGGGAGQPTITPGSGVTFEGGEYKISQQYKRASALKMSANTWRITGSVTP